MLCSQSGLPGLRNQRTLSARRVAKVAERIVNSTWHLLRSGVANSAENMAMDHALLESAPVLGNPVLRFYGWTEPAASFGYFQKHSDVEKMTQLRPLVRRPTGGGLVPHDADWTYSLVFPPLHSWYALKAVESYRQVHAWICEAFCQFGVFAELASECRRCGPGQCFEGWEKFDVVWRGRKIAGAAQRRTKDGLLIQGSVQPPPVKLERTDWEKAMCAVAVVGFSADWADFQPDGKLKQSVAGLARDIYSQPAHNQRR